MPGRLTIFSNLRTWLGSPHNTGKLSLLKINNLAGKVVLRGQAQGSVVVENSRRFIG